MDVSGPSSSVDATPYSMCFVLLAGECHAGSALNEVYVNAPVAYDPGYCVPGASWVNVPCVLFGDNAPAGGIRQFRISQEETATGLIPDLSATAGAAWGGIILIRMPLH